METCIYKGTVTHRRFKPKRHFFSYKTFSILFDLDELEDLEKKISIFSLNKFNLFSFYNKDHGDRDGKDLRIVISNLKKYNIGFNISGMTFVTQIFGYVFNPLFFIIYNNKELKVFFMRLKILLMSSILTFFNK